MKQKKGDKFEIYIIFADKSPHDSHYMAQDQVKNILVFKVAWKLGVHKVFEKVL